VMGNTYVTDNGGAYRWEAGEDKKHNIVCMYARQNEVKRSIKG